MPTTTIEKTDYQKKKELVTGVLALTAFSAAVYAVSEVTSRLIIATAKLILRIPRK